MVQHLRQDKLHSTERNLSTMEVAWLQFARRMSFLPSLQAKSTCVQGPHHIAQPKLQSSPCLCMDNLHAYET